MLGRIRFRRGAALTLLAMLIPCRGPAASASSNARSPFGLHGPQFSHWLHAQPPHLWAEGEARFQVLADTGAGWARQDFWWGLVEPQKGTFRWDDFDRAVAGYERYGLNLLAILCYASTWSGGTSPDTDDERERFGHYVFKMVERYRGRVGAWEVWNEPNIQPFWSPRPDPELYAKLLTVAYTAAKQADPNCTVVGGVFAGPDAKFLEGMYQHGVQGHFDVLSYHNYGQNLDFTTEWPAVEKLRQVMREHGDGDKPIWHTESGFYTGPVGLSEHDQASRIVRYSVGLLGLGIERTFQLTLNDWTDDPQHHDLSVYRGLTHADYSVKPSYRAYQTMCRRLGDKRFAGAIRPAEGVWGFLFDNDAGQTVLVLWRDWGTGPTATILDLDVPVVLVQQLDGDWKVHRAETGEYELSIGADPVYVVNPGSAVTNQRYVSWPNPVLTRIPRSADAVIDVEVFNPTSEPLSLRIYPHWVSSRRYEAGTIGPGSSRILHTKVDASLLDVGRHEFFWDLAPPNGGEPIARGFRVVEVQSPMRLFLESLNHLDAAAPTLPARVEYSGREPVTGSAVLLVDGKPAGDPVKIELQPDRSTRVELPLNLAAFQGGQAVPVELAVTTQGLKLTQTFNRPLLACPRAPANAKIDGQLAEWRDQSPAIKPGQMRWEYVNARETPDPNDLSVTGWVAYDERGLWIAVEVKDDTLAFPESRAIWNWDSLQVGLDLGSDAQPDEPYDDDDLEVELGLREGGSAWCYLGACPIGWPAEQLSDKLVGVVRPDRDRGVTNYELLIPAALLVSSTTLEPGTVMGFSLLVNDNDGQGRSGWLELTPGIGLGKMPARFAWLWLR